MGLVGGGVVWWSRDFGVVGGWWLVVGGLGGGLGGVDGPAGGGVV